jgi:hypothetical protein
LVCDAADSGSLASWQSFGKLLFFGATLVGFGKQRRRQHLPLDAPK